MAICTRKFGEDFNKTAFEEANGTFSFTTYLWYQFIKSDRQLHPSLKSGLSSFVGLLPSIH